MLAEAYANSLQDYMNMVQAIYGPPYKGIPLSTAVAIEIWKKKAIAIGSAWSRKEAKDHGEGGLHGGAPLKGLGVAIVDDVITSGGSVEDAFAYVRSQAATPPYVSLGLTAWNKAQTVTNPL